MTGKQRILFVLFLFLLAPVFGQELEIETRTGRDSILIGEQMEFSIIITSNERIHSAVPVEDNLFPAAIEIISQTTDSIIEDRKFEYINKYLITGFDSGVYVINPIPVLVNLFDKMDTLATDPVSLVIYSPEVDTTAAIKDIKEPANTPFTLEELLPYAPYAGGLLVVFLVAFMVYRYLRRKRNTIETLRPKLPPHVTALNELERIKKEKLWQQGKVKDYYSQLSDTIRIYIEERYNIPAMESVTSEILESFRKYSWDDENLMDILENLLQLSDLVKFAKEDPLPSDNEMNLNNAYIFIEKTKPAESKEKELMEQE
jgi:hypothetical protein